MKPTVSNHLIQLCRAHRNLAEQRLNQIGLYAGQEAILLVLLQQDGLSQSEVGERLGVEAPTVTKALKRLQKAGFVRREADRDDRRVSRVYLTAEGRRLGPQITQIWTEIEAQLVQGVSEAETLLLLRLLEQLQRNLQRG